MPDLAFLPGIKRPQLQGRQVLYDDGQHLVILDGAILAFTPVEYALLLRLLKRAGEPVSFGLDILCLHEYGYLLLARSDEQAAER